MLACDISAYLLLLLSAVHGCSCDFHINANSHWKVLATVWETLIGCCWWVVFPNYLQTTSMPWLEGCQATSGAHCSWRHTAQGDGVFGGGRGRGVGYFSSEDASRETCLCSLTSSCSSTTWGSLNVVETPSELATSPCTSPFFLNLPKCNQSWCSRLVNSEVMKTCCVNRPTWRNVEGPHPFLIIFHELVLI